MEEKKEKSVLRHYLGLGPAFKYFFRKPNPEHKGDFSLRFMHGVNKLSIIMFLLGITYLILKRFI